MLALAVAALFQVQTQPTQTFKDWKIDRREPNPRTGQLEFVAIIQGDEAIPLNMAQNHEVFDIKGLKLSYFTDPKKPGFTFEEIKLRSDTARLDNEKDRIDLAGNVRIEKPPPPRGDGTVLEAPQATLFFRKRFVCPEHGGNATTSGKCPVCGAELKPHTFTTLEAPKTFELTKPDPPTHMTGESLTANDDIRQIRVERDGFLVTAGNPKELLPSSAPPPPSPSKPAVTEMRSKGPMIFTESESDILVTAEKDVRIRRAEVRPGGPETTVVTADSARLVARKASGGDRKGPDPEQLTARGHITVTGPDGTARAETLVWQGSGDFDVAELEGQPAEVTRGRNTIRSKFVTIERFLGVSTFREEVAARLVPGGDASAPPVALQSRQLTTRATPGGKEIEEIEATGDVVLDGLTQGAGQKPGRAEADRFYWNQGEDRGFLERRPFVRVVQEDSTIYAPRIVLEGRSMIVLKGPKLVVLTQKDAEGRETRTSATSEADIVLDSSGEKNTVIRLQDRCAVRTSEVQLFADRMTVLTPKGGEGIESVRASGRVRARQLKEGATLFGEWLYFKPKTETAPQTLTLTGSPLTIIDAGRKVATQEQVIIEEKIDPETGEKVQLQKMRGGKHGVRIVIDERPK
jgi:lipopolysaccharide export system protein LptA